MRWTVRYRRDAFCRSSLWIIPLGSMAAALAVAPVIRWIDDQTRWTLLGFGLDGARAVLNSANATRTIAHPGRSAVVLAFDVAGVVDIATRAGCAVELVPQVGDVQGFGSRPRNRGDDLGQGVRREPCTSTDRD